MTTPTTPAIGDVVRVLADMAPEERHRSFDVVHGPLSLPLGWLGALASPGDSDDPFAPVKANPPARRPAAPPGVSTWLQSVGAELLLRQSSWPPQGHLHPGSAARDAASGSPESTWWYPTALGAGQGSNPWLSVSPYAQGPPPDGPVIHGHSAALDTLQRWDVMTPGLPSLRVGWIWIAGTAVLDGVEQRFCHPLLSRSVEIRAYRGSRQVVPLGAWDLWPLVPDDTHASALERAAVFGSNVLTHAADQQAVAELPVLLGWVNEVLRASTLEEVTRLEAPIDPSHTRPESGLWSVVGYGIYGDQGIDPSQPRQTLHAWAQDPAIRGTAFAQFYVGDAGEPRPIPRDDPGAALPVTGRQASVVWSARTHPVTVVSGPPGTGKSQTAATVALDAIARGESVLIATGSAGATAALADLLDRVPGPTPVLFNGGDQASALADTLVADIHRPSDPGASTARFRRTALAHTDARRRIDDHLLGLERRTQWAENASTLLPILDQAPVLRRPDGDQVRAHARALLREATAPGRGWRARRARARAIRALCTLLGLAETTPQDRIEELLNIAELRASALDPGDDPWGPGALWAELVRLETQRGWDKAAETASTALLSVTTASRQAVVRLAQALRSGRAVRRAHLRSLDLRQITKALPLWVGTLQDIEHLLPATAGGFDLVILDEASQIDQHTAAAALLRARDAVIIGDPRQLRFVSFLADDDVEAAVARHGCTAVRDRLDLRRVSAFDLGASAAPVITLDEHFRSVPHLIGFAAHHFYDDRLLVATRHPVNETASAITLIEVDGTRDGKGVNHAEVAETVRLATQLLAEGVGTIGVISPYRPQVEALTAALGAQIPVEVLQERRIQVATVHGFQGAECDVVIASFGLSEEHGRSRSFLEDPHLFNVLTTRARQRLYVLCSVTDVPPGLLADYLRWAAQPPPPFPHLGAQGDAWTEALAQVLADQGTPTRCGYQVGRWQLDLVVGEGVSAVAVTTRLHPDGPAAHVQRHLALARAGWRQTEAWKVTYDGDAVRAALDLAALVAQA